MKKFRNIKIEKLPASTVEITGEIESGYLEEEFIKSLKKIAANLEIPGFRKGHVSEQVALQKFGEMNVLEDAAEEALQTQYPSIIESEKLSVIGNPKVTLRKLARNNPLEFSIVVAVVPEFTLPNYTALAKKNNALEEAAVTQEEVDAVILEIRKHHAHDEMHKNGTFTDHNHAPIEEKDLPELTPEIIKTLGDFTNKEDLEKKIRENIIADKQKRAKEKRRLAILDAIMTETEIEIPEVLVESELDKMMAQFEDDVARAGIPFEDYIKNIGKERSQMRGEWRETAVKKAKVQLILNKIADKEKITPDGDTIRNEAEKILMVYKDADPLRVRVYVGMMMTNEKVLEFLESQK